MEKRTHPVVFGSEGRQGGNRDSRESSLRKDLYAESGASCVGGMAFFTRSMIPIVIWTLTQSEEGSGEAELHSALTTLRQLEVEITK